MILFLISFLMVFASSYFITSIISPKKSILGLIYLFLLAFAQIVLTFEILSLFSAINELWVLTSNVIFFFGSFLLWRKKAYPIWSLDCSDFYFRVKNSLKLDKFLLIISFAFVFFIIVSLILCFIMPVSSFDALAYHVARCLFWIKQGNLNHFITQDPRNACFPINSELLYTWVLLFVKKDVFLGFFSFVGYFISMVSIYNLLGYPGFSMRRKLWVIFVLSSFASVIVQASGTETDIIISALISSSIFLFWNGIKSNNKIPLFMSALAYALAIGTKTTAILAIPGVGLFLLALSIYNKKMKPLAVFCALVIVNFLIFSSYNYILNFLEFSNFFGCLNLLNANQSHYGIMAIPANFIKYIFLFFDSTGFLWSKHYGVHLLKFREFFLSILHLGYIKDGVFCNYFNGELIEPAMGAGVLGLLVFLPCAVWALIKPLFKKSRKVFLIFLFALMFFVNLISISYSLAFMTYTVRFIMTFIVLSSPVLVYSYTKKHNFYKFLIACFVLFYFVFVTTHLRARPFNYAIWNLNRYHSITKLRYNVRCDAYEIHKVTKNNACRLANQIRKKYSNKNKIIVFMDEPEDIYNIKFLEFQGYKVDFDNVENLPNINLKNYNLIIAPNRGQFSGVVFQKKPNATHKYIIPCNYFGAENKASEDFYSLKYPYRSYCIFGKDVVNKNNLELIDRALILNKLDNRGDDYYNLFENKNNPLIK